MTQNEIDAKRIEMRNGQRDEIVSQELECREMIDSIICYGGFGLSAEEIVYEQEHSYYDYLKSYKQKLGVERVLELIREQINDIKEIHHNVYYDNESGYYNSIEYVR